MCTFERLEPENISHFSLKNADQNITEIIPKIVDHQKMLAETFWLHPLAANTQEILFLPTTQLWLCAVSAQA